MSITQSDIDAMNEALASGERMVRHGDKTVEYRSIDELIRARDQLQALLDAAAGKPSGPLSRQTRLYHAGRGFDGRIPSLRSFFGRGFE
jgi:hypothetical protein